MLFGGQHLGFQAEWFGAKSDAFVCLGWDLLSPAPCPLRASFSLHLILERCGGEAAFQVCCAGWQDPYASAEEQVAAASIWDGRKELHKSPWSLQTAGLTLLPPLKGQQPPVAWKEMVISPAGTVTRQGQL